MSIYKEIIKKNACNYFKKFLSLKKSIIISILFAASTVSALDVVIIVDTTGSTGALLPNWKANLDPVIIQPIKTIDPNARFALVSHLDFPFNPYGSAGEYAYRLESPLDSNIAPLLTALNSLTSGSGGDSKESQFEAVRQANTGLGLDLNNNGSFADAGDIVPAPLGFNPITNSFTIHLTSPLNYHNDPVVEPNYPFPGVVNNPATLNDAITAMLSQNNTYYVFNPNPLFAGFTDDGTRLEMGVIDKQTGKLLDTRLSAFAPSSAEKLANATGGKIFAVGADLSGLREAVEEIIAIERPCPPGQIPVELPFGVVCVPIPSTPS